MSHLPAEQSSTTDFDIRGMPWSLVLNVAVPWLLYTLSKNYYHTSEIVALCVAAIFPIGDSIFETVRHRQLDIIAILSLLRIATGIVGVLLGGDAKLLLIGGSFFTGALGLVCFLSFLFPKPLMFYIGRQMMAGRDTAKLATYNQKWNWPHVRFAHRLITLIWGCALIGEFLVRVVLAYTFPPAVVLEVAPIITTVILVATLLWTFAYVRSSRRKAEERANMIH
jgi:hypothetical protein